MLETDHLDIAPEVRMAAGHLRAQVERLPEGTLFWALSNITSRGYRALWKKTSRSAITIGWSSLSDSRITNPGWFSKETVNWPPDSMNPTMRVELVDETTAAQIEMLLIHSPASAKKFFWKIHLGGEVDLVNGRYILAK